VETVFRQHAALLQAACTKPGPASIALDGKTLRGSFDNFNDRAAAQLLSAFATDTSLVLAHVDIAEKSNEIPAAQTLLSQLGVEGGVYTGRARTGRLTRATATAFYVSNKPLAAIRAAQAIRAHWGIETTSHHSRDVTFGEDRSRIRFNPGVFARLRSFGFNIL